MFGIGTGEILVFILIAILVLGPQETVKYIKKIKKYIFQIKEYKKDIESEINDHINDDDTEPR